ncbi:VanZ family protein [Mechercharimyces sp. CAU 1602]|uniref:VanZ family protein n=1 Tax=Mechercharimyces sp. CAU 1602 TaxID=2973933 RepID=UPI002163A3E5|nr:VanZ family protein [Mechercharimyces sp. CAU 1602]MCS1351502.1 VanZ family protein [Mechercharimyces sp. CAU 1602]
MKRIILLFISVIPFFFFLSRDAFDNYSYRVDVGNIIELLLNISPIIIYVLWDAMRKKESTIKIYLIKSLYYVYIYHVLFYVLLYIPFYQFISQPLLPELDQEPIRYNLVLFQTISGSITFINIYGNLLLMLPLGILLPLIYDGKLNKSKKTIPILFFIILSIEVIQLIVSYIDAKFSEWPYSRSFDVDDLMLNFAGAILGYFIYRVIIVPVSNKVKRRRVK